MNDSREMLALLKFKCPVWVSQFAFGRYQYYSPSAQNYTCANARMHVTLLLCTQNFATYMHMCNVHVVNFSHQSSHYALKRYCFILLHCTTGMNFWYFFLEMRENKNDPPIIPDCFVYNFLSIFFATWPAHIAINFKCNNWVLSKAKDLREGWYSCWLGYCDLNFTITFWFVMFLMQFYELIRCTCTMCM